MPEASRLPLTVALPQTPRIADDDKVNVRNLIQWAQNHSRSVASQLRRANETVQQILTGAIPPLPAHAATHVPETGTDPLGTAAWSGAWAATSDEGTSDNLLRADGNLIYPEALGTAAARTKQLVLTASSFDAVLTATGFGAPMGAGEINFVPPGLLAGPGAYVGVWGNIGAGVSAGTNTMLTFNKTDFNLAFLPAVYAIKGLISNLYQTVGDSTLGFQIQASAVPSAVAASNTVGGELLVAGGSPINDNWTGRLTGIRVTPRATGLTNHTVGDIDSFIANGVSGGLTPFITSVDVPVLTGYRVKDINLITGGTVTDQLGLDVEDQTAGTNIWTARGYQKFECRSSDFIASAAQKGFIAYDGSDYWRHYVTSSGVPVIVNIGATPPAT
jgi:hypothetical protein